MNLMRNVLLFLIFFHSRNEEMYSPDSINLGRVYEIIAIRNRFKTIGKLWLKFKQTLIEFNYLIFDWVLLWYRRPSSCICFCFFRVFRPPRLPTSPLNLTLSLSHSLKNQTEECRIGDRRIEPVKTLMIQNGCINYINIIEVIIHNHLGENCFWLLFSWLIFCCVWIFLCFHLMYADQW